MKYLSNPVGRTALLGGAIAALAIAYVIARENASSFSELVRNVFHGLFIIWIVFFSLHVMRTILVIVASIAPAGPLLNSMKTRGIVRTIWDIVRRRVYGELRLSVMFILWGFAISAMLGAVALQGGLDEIELNFVKPVDDVSHGRPDTYVRSLTLISEDNNTLRYVQDITKLAKIFSRLGAKCMVVERPQSWSRRTTAALDSLDRIGLPVTYEVWPFRGNDAYVTGNTTEEQQRLARLSVVKAGSVPFENMGRIPTIIRWYPCLSTGGMLKTDVSLAVVGRILGYPDSVRPQPYTGRVVYGDIAVPVSSEGEALSYPVWPLNQYFLNVSAGRETDSDTLRFYKYPEGTTSMEFPESVASEIRDKVIVVVWLVMNDAYHASAGYSEGQIIESLLRGRVFNRWRWEPGALALLIVVMSGGLCFRLRLRVAVPIILAIGLLAGVTGYWAVTAHLLLTKLVYPMGAALLSAVIFPLVRLSHEYPPGTEKLPQ